MHSRCRAMASLIGFGAAILLSAGMGRAEITVADSSQNPATGVYNYTVTLDSGAYVNPGDGFVIYGFPGLTSWSLAGSGGSGSLSSSGNGTTSIGPFELLETSPSNALTDGNAQAIADTDADSAALDNDITISPAGTNLSLVWLGPPTPYTGAATATLTLDSSVLGADTVGIVSSVDRSGDTPGTTYGTDSGTVFVPTTVVPEPIALGGCLVFAGVTALRRRRRME
jgi:hypothetical protein